jgi:hypothetical protein
MAHDFAKGHHYWPELSLDSTSDLSDDWFAPGKDPAARTIAAR